jgi:hypothetical protein
MHTLYVRAHRYRNFIFDDSTTHSQEKLKMQYINVNLLCVVVIIIILLLLE